MHFRRDDLRGLTLDDVNRRAQDLMAGNDLVDAALERGGVEKSKELVRDGNVVGGSVWSKTIEEPKSLLRKRERQRAAPRSGGDRGRRKAVSCSHCRLDHRPEFSYSGSLEDSSQGDFD